MIHLVAGVNPDVARRLMQGDHEVQGLAISTIPNEVERCIDLDRSRSLLVLSPEFMAREHDTDASLDNWCASVEELDVPVILASSASPCDLDVIRELSASFRIDVWQYLEAGSGVSLGALIGSASLAALALAAWHLIRRSTTRQLGASEIAISRALFQLPQSFSREIDICAYGISATWYNRVLRCSGLASFSVLRRVARVLRASSLHTQRGLPMVDIARESGCGSLDTLYRDVHLFAGVTPTRLFDSCSNDELLERGVALAILPSDSSGDTRASA